MAQIKTKDDSHGKLWDKDTMFMRTQIGSGTDKSGTEYEVSYQMNGLPIVRNKATGKWFTLSMEDLVNLAKTKGIDD